MPRKRREDQKGSNNRVHILRKRIKEKKLVDHENIMIEIMDIFNETRLIPEVGEYYTFVYNAKTPGINYDQHPLVAVTSVYNWGFQGINYHWNNVRRYTWEEVPGFLHIIRRDEINSMRNIKYAYYRNN